MLGLFVFTLHISIHKALTGLDQLLPLLSTLPEYFNPQGPHGPRQKGNKVTRVTEKFQSTRPSRASTQFPQYRKPNNTFQSTRPSRASTTDHLYIVSNLLFQSTRPSRASTAIFTNFFQLFFSFLSIMLHFSHSTPLPIQKAPIFYALFPAFSSANIPTFPCPLHIRTKKSTVLPHQIQALPLYAPPYFYIGFPDYKISGCLYLYQ